MGPLGRAVGDPKVHWWGPLGALVRPTDCTGEAHWVHWLGSIDRTREIDQKIKPQHKH